MQRKRKSDRDIERGKRLFEALLFLFPGDTKQKLQERFQLSGPGRLYQFVKEGRPISNDMISRLDALGVSMAWLLRGEGEMMRGEESTYTPDPDIISVRVPDVTPPKECPRGGVCSSLAAIARLLAAVLDAHADEKKRMDAAQAIKRALKDIGRYGDTA